MAGKVGAEKNQFEFDSRKNRLSGAGQTKIVLVRWEIKKYRQNFSL